MGIRGRVAALALIVVIAVAAMATIVSVALRSSDQLLQRVIAAHNQLEATTAVAVQANHYSEQIAERLLMGDSERQDFARARDKLSGAFDHLRRVSVVEVAILEGRPEQLRERQEIVRIDRMRVLYREVDRAAERVFLLRDQGKLAEASQLFRSQIEDRFDSDLGRMIEAAIAGENAEVAEADQALTALHRRLALLGGAAAVVLLGGSLATALVLARSLSNPIWELTRGAVAIGQGNLDTRISVSGRNELALLAHRFNEMAAELARQRAALISAQTDLEAKVSERTEQLADANERLIELDRSRVRFLADISHELRTPLTALRGEAEVTLRGGAKSEQVYRETLEQVVAQSAAMSHLVDDLMFLARSEGDQIRVERAPLSVGRLIEAAGQEARVLGKAKRIEIRVAPPSPALTVIGDERRLGQALLILLDNAIRYSDSNAEIATEGRLVGEHVEIVVRNTGIGITAEDLPHVFERFYRAPAARRQNPSGSGLGLSIAKWIVERHGGDLSVSSDAGITEARMRLPLATSHARLDRTQGVG